LLPRKRSRVLQPGERLLQLVELQPER
jgi:hypothetical protein